MNRPIFSVIVPVYNASDSIEETVASVLMQTERDFELWLVDDGSTDETPAHLQRLRERDPRIQILSLPNGGVAAARNAGAAKAQGELLAFLDADDLWLPTKLERHRQHHRDDPECAASFARIAFLPEGVSNFNEASTQSSVPSGPLALSQILGENPVCTSSNLVVSRQCWQAIGGFRDGMQYAEDQEWLARVVDSGREVRGLDTLLVGYRMSTGGLSANLQAMYAGWHSLAGDYASHAGVASARATYCRYLARRALRSGGAPTLSLHFALAGLFSSPSAFLKDRRRGVMTLLGALVSPLLPRRLRMRLFA
ncbi:glycosyltransferase family 2 protein [Salinicola aestuarinus]|uniref:glycosyltransferase family 2 protein n=1 Tax=Salinicola aestuarinus TaxID=1949082 RepID=UPI000DA24224|nr:glycosyltransferase family A protein [Salinicola aestuarinus]